MVFVVPLVVPVLPDSHHMVGVCYVCSPEDVSTAALGRLSQPPLTDTTVTLYSCPHGRLFIVQPVPLELQRSVAPVLLSATTWKYWASGLRDQDTVMASSAHRASTATSRGGQGAAGRQRGQRKLILMLFNIV